jgi:hypothetical protein
LTEHSPAQESPDWGDRLGSSVPQGLAPTAAALRPGTAGAAKAHLEPLADRFTLRVREPRDVDLVLGQGMLRAGWDAHNLNALGPFLVSAPRPR